MTPVAQALLPSMFSVQNPLCKYFVNIAISRGGRPYLLAMLCYAVLKGLSIINKDFLNNTCTSIRLQFTERSLFRLVDRWRDINMHWK